MRRLAEGRAGAVVLFLWAFCEAFFWPLIPDSALMAFAFAAPRHWPRLWVATVSGSVVGGLIGLQLSGLGWSWPLPLITDRMQDSVDGWLAAEGAGGLRHQPFSFVPYKTFVAASGAFDLNPAAWAGWTFLMRGGRMAVSALIGAGGGWILWRWIPSRARAMTHATTVLVGTVLLTAGIAFTYNVWS
jgi:membrane protein YqaA with SNARE-associated domain